MAWFLVTSNWNNVAVAAVVAALPAVVAVRLLTGW